MTGRAIIEIVERAAGNKIGKWHLVLVHISVFFGRNPGERLSLHVSQEKTSDLILITKLHPYFRAAGRGLRIYEDTKAALIKVNDRLLNLYSEILGTRSYGGDTLPISCV